MASSGEKLIVSNKNYCITNKLSPIQLYLRKFTDDNRSLKCITNHTIMINSGAVLCLPSNRLCVIHTCQISE